MWLHLIGNGVGWQRKTVKKLKKTNKTSEQQQGKSKKVAKRLKKMQKVRSFRAKDEKNCDSRFGDFRLPRQLI
jgi:hypothetical protein